MESVLTSRLRTVVGQLTTRHINENSALHGGCHLISEYRVVGKLECAGAYVTL